MKYDEKLRKKHFHSIFEGEFCAELWSQKECDKYQINASSDAFKVQIDKPGIISKRDEVRLEFGTSSWESSNPTTQQQSLLGI